MPASSAAPSTPGATSLFGPAAHLRRTAPRAALLAAALVLACALPCARGDTGFAAPVTTTTPQIISSDPEEVTNYYPIINQITGAERFYFNGYFGNNAMIANVEAGFVWNGHEATGGVSSFISNAPINAITRQYDYHATAVGFMMVGLGPLSSGGYYYYQFGMAPGAFLSTAAIATDWVGTTGEFNITASTFVYGYKTAMQDGVDRPVVPGISFRRPVDVVNSSWGYDDPAGTAQTTMIIDALTYTNHQTVCIAAGNHDSATAPVGGPATAFNVIAVGALGDDTTHPPYQTLAPFSNTGPNDFYNPQTQQTITGVRPGVSIVAPGTDLVAPAYAGATGSNSDGSLFDVSGFPPEDLNRLYFMGIAGTSFASPIVAGGAALLVDAGYANYADIAAVDGRVIKAVLLNSAGKTAGWDNHTVTRPDGVLFTDRGLDFRVGAGALNLDRAYDQYLTSSYIIPSTAAFPQKLMVQNTGWAYSHISAAGPHNYQLCNPLQQGDILTVTADWFIPVTFNTAAVPDPITDNFSGADLHAEYFDQLDLQVWHYLNGLPDRLVAECFSPYINVDHLHFAVPEDGSYLIRVTYVGTTYDLNGNAPGELDYAIAWSVTPVPEPATLLLTLIGAMALLHRGRHRR
jgi:hypothetical protein